jgi:hypothetical protein
MRVLSEYRKAISQAQPARTVSGYIDRIVAVWPPLSEKQLDDIAALLQRAGGDDVSQ